MWYIISYNQIHGYSSGAFEDLSMLFYAGPSEDQMSQNWAPLVTEACSFDSHEAAKEFAEKTWGKWSSTAFMFAYMEETHPVFGDEYARKQIDIRDEFRRRLVMKSVTPEELRDMSKNVFDTGMRYSEKWIVDIMAKEQDNVS